MRTLTIRTVANRVCALSRGLPLTLIVLTWLVAGNPGTAHSQSTQQSPPTIRAVAFDAFPIFDPRPAFQVVQNEFPEQGIALRKAWFAKIFSYTWLRTLGEDQYQDFPTVMRDALRFCTADLELEMSTEQEKRILRAFFELPVWPDVKPALKTLREEDIRLVFLSNMSEEMLRSNLRHNGIEDHFEFVLSTDRARAFKPSPHAYRLGIDTLELSKEEVLFTAFAGWDAAGAKWFGYPTFWVNRVGFSAEELGVTLDGESRGLTDLVDLVLQRRMDR